MSERDNDAGRYGRDARRPSEWPEETGASVFRRSAEPRAPERGWRPEDRGVDDQRSYPGQDPYSGRGGYPADGPYPSQSRYPGQDRYPGQSPYQGDDPYPGLAPYPGEPRTREQAWPPDGGPPGRQGRGGGRRADRPGREARPSRGAGGGFPLGVGALVGVAGLTCVLLALMVLPWFTAGGQDVDLSDLRAAFESDEANPADPANPVDQPASEPADGTEPSLPDDVTSPGQVGEAVEDGVRDVAGDAATAAIDSGKARYLELYTERLWAVVAVATALAVVFSTILAPRSFALSLLLGFRRLSGVVTVLAAGLHGAALWALFSGDGAPEPAVGVWLGLAGFGAVLVGCIVGPKG